MRDAGAMDQDQFADFYGRYAALCIRAGVKPLAPEAAAALLTELEIVEPVAVRDDGSFGCRSMRGIARLHESFVVICDFSVIQSLAQLPRRRAAREPPSVV